MEDAIQRALLKALQIWPRDTPPDEPLAWLYRVAVRGLIDERRRCERQRFLLQRHSTQVGAEAHGDTGETAVLTGSAPADSLAAERLRADLDDDVVRQLYYCCDPVLPAQSQRVLALKSLFGIDVRAIALLCFTSDASVYKRLERAKRTLRAHTTWRAEMEECHLLARLPAMQSLVYLLFSSGYTLQDDALLSERDSLCHEAQRLAGVLAMHPVTGTPASRALAALLCLHSARLPGRREADGTLLLLSEQDRSRWDAAFIRQGIRWLELSAAGQSVTRWHLEASIAARHALARSHDTTDWECIENDYRLLERIDTSPLHRMHRAIARAEKGRNRPSALDALHLLDQGSVPISLRASWRWQATLAHLHWLAGNDDIASVHHRAALAVAPNAGLRSLLLRRASRQALTTSGMSSSDGMVANPGSSGSM